MTTKMVQVNCETNEVTEREMTAEEIKSEKAMQDYAKEVDIENEAKNAARNAILERLGVTADEITLLLA